jgi:hypothetical protein
LKGSAWVGAYLALLVRDYVNALVLGRLALVDTLGLRQLPVEAGINRVIKPKRGERR